LMYGTKVLVDVTYYCSNKIDSEPWLVYNNQQHNNVSYKEGDCEDRKMTLLSFLKCKLNSQL